MTGWNAKESTYNGVYAKKYGNKIFWNTGIIALSASDMVKARRVYDGKNPQGFITLTKFNEKVASYEARGVETKVLKEKKPYGTIHRLMTRVV